MPEKQILTIPNIFAPSPEDHPMKKVDTLSGKEREKYLEYMEKMGYLAPKDSGLGELPQRFMGSSVQALRGIGATAEEVGLGDDAKGYFQSILNRNQQWNQPEEQSAMGYVAGAVGSGLGSTAVIAPAMVADAVFGTKGAATFATVFSQSLGENIQRNRAVYGEGNEEKSVGLAAVESSLDAVTEIALGTVPMLGKTLKGLTVAGKRQLVKGMFREAEKQLGRSGAKRFFLGMAKNGLEEGAEEAVQYVNSWAFRAFGGDPTNEFNIGEMTDAMAQGAIGGAALGMLGGASNVQTYGKQRNWLPGASKVPGIPSPVVPGVPEATVDVPSAPDKASINLISAVAEELGMNVRFFDEENAPEAKTADGNPVNGFYDSEKKEFWIDRTDPDMNPLETLGHEFYHANDKMFGQFNELINSGINEAGKKTLSATEDDYAKAGMPGAGLTEFNADTFGKMWTDPQFWQDVTERAEKLDAGMGQKMLDALQEFIKKVRAKLKEIGTPEEKQLFDNMGALRDEAVRITAEVKRRNGTSTETENVVGVHGSNLVNSVPVSDINVDPARFQFKSKANKITGVDESNQIGGEWDQRTAGNLYLWEDKTGKKFVVNGHHRLALAKGKSVQNVNAIIDREANGVTAEQARRNGTLINIRDGQGDVRDYAAFVRSSKLDEESAQKEGVLSREKGRTGYLIGRYASDNLYSMYRNGDISDSKTATIADITRGDEALEAAGIHAAKNNMHNSQLREFLKLLKITKRTKAPVQGDLFGFDDSAIKTAEALSKLAAKHINQIKNAINSGKGAIKNPEGASKINVHAGENSEKLLQEARQDLDRWEHWSTDKELYQQLTQEAGLTEAPQPETTKAEVPKVEAPKPAPVKTEAPKNNVRFNIDSDTPLLTPEEDANDFQLIPESSKDADKRAAAKAKADKEASERAKQKAKEATPELGMTENTPVEKPERKSGYEVHVQNNGSVTIDRYEIMPNGVPVLDGNSVIKAKDAQEALDIIENNRLPVPDRDLQKLKTVAKQAKPIIQDSTPEKAWGSENKVVSTDQYEAAKQRMKDRLKNLNMGFDPGILSDGAVMASYHIEAGARKFTDFTKRMMDDLGEGIKPYLKSIYESARRMPGMEDVAKDMDSTQDVDAFNFDAPQAESKDLPSVLREVIDMDASGQVKQQRLIRLAKSFNISDKEIQERCEAEVVAMGREINAENISDDAKYQKLIDLYDRQPNFSKRTSTSVANQAYSTPVPLAWILGKRIGLAGNSVYEPTAGTGMLTIAGDVPLTSVNEIDTLRRDILSKQGFKSVTSKDAVDGHPNKTFDRVIMNPPFGAGNMKVFDGYKLSKIDHIIAAEALKALSDNGRAAIIIGANTEGRGGVGKAALQDHIFMSYLYDKFNVKDNYIVSGDLYRKQGAGYPVRVLTLDGRRTTSENIDHPTDIEIVKDWDTLYNNLKGELGHGTLPETERSDSVDRISKDSDTQGQNAPNGRRHSGGNGSSLDANSVASGENSRSSGVLGERNEQLPKGRGSLGTNQSQGSVLPESAQSGSSVRSGVGNSTGSLPLSSGNAGNTTENQHNSGRSGSERSGLPVSDGRQSVSSSAPSEGIQVGEERGELNNTYKPASKNPTDQMDVVIPRYMADAVAQALTRLKDKVGDIDAYVQKELAYETPEELYKALADVQIDGVALAIQAIRNHTGFVLGDQTGIGKGRQCAAMIRWAQKHDITPVFFTADQNLFTDMYRDGKDIGNVFNPLIMASDKDKAEITDADGKVIIPLLSARKQDEAFQSLMNDSSKHDVVFTSYSQLSSSEGRQHKILRDLVDSQKCLFIMDEAHKASGDSTVGRFFNGILSNPNVEVLYASATFAKRPDNMSLYFRTNISKALDNEEKLMDVLTRGGVPLQQILSQGLAIDGQYTRRERDFTGVTFDMVMAEPIDKETGEVDKIAKADLVTTYNRVAEVLKELVDYNEAVKKAIKAAHKGDYTTTGQREKLAIEMATFASTSHNFVAQLLLASKCNICVQQAVNTFKKGQKPVIALTNTLEANLKDFVKSAGLAVNDPLPMKFAHILENAVWRMYHFTMKAKTGEKTVITFKPEDYGLREEHKKILERIHGLDDVDLPISPIDYIKDQLERNGIRTAEITGRTYTVDYSKAVPVLSKREVDDKNKNKIVNDFNSGKIDAVILNSSGSTGLSIQAAAWFKDQRARRMDLAQPSLDIAIVMQTLGRINRTGQVVKPSYSFLSSPLNAEKRQFMVLSRKLQSLNANTTANNKSGIELGDDIINKYGDIVAQQFINENPDIAMTLNLDDEIQKEGSQAKPTEDLIVKLTGKMTLLPDETQGEIYEDLSARYNDLVEYLKMIGDYDLEISVHDDWDVISGEETELAPGDPNGSIFEQPLKMKQISLSEKYSIQPAADIRNKIKENLGADRNEVVERLKNDLADINSAIENLAQAYEGSDRKPEYIDDRKTILRSTLNLFGNFIIRNTNEMLEINIGEESYDGTIIGYRGTKKFNPRRPIIPSKIMIDFAIAGKIGKISIPYSRILNEEVTYGKSLYGIEHYFTGQKVNIRSDRYAITGNLMRGLEYTNAGKVVTYKTNKGEIETGLLMPKTWQPGQLVRDPRNEIHTTQEAMDHLLTNQGNISSNDGLNIIRPYGSFVIEVPKSRKQGGKYYLDQELVRVTGDFASSGNTMRTAPLEQETLEVAIAYLLTKKDTILKKVDRKYSLKRTEQENIEDESAEPRFQFSLVRNPDTLKRLEKEEYITTYRAAQIGQDGKLYPPMAGIIGKEWGPEIVLGKWEQADERPEMVRQIPGASGAVKNTFKLNKGNGSSIYAAYNPYIHSSTMPLNDQFASAYKRPNLVTLEVRVPKSELTGTYKADMAKDSVGLHSWKSGVVAGQLPKSKERKVILSRWDKPIRIVPESEIAEKIAELLKGENIVIPENVVTPKLLAELEKLGVPIERKEFSLKRHRQVNPIRQAGEVQDQHEALINEKYETRSNKVVNEEAEQRLAGNGGMDGTIRMMLDGDFNIGSDVSQRVMQVVLNSDEFKELDVNDRERISDLYINAAGTDVARSLAARRLGVLDMEDIQSIQAHVNAFMAKLDKSNPRNILRKQIMEQFGFDIDNLPDDIVNNPGLLDEVLRRMISERAGNFDKFYEFWINGILSAPTTHVANMIGNAANAGYELGLKRLAEAAINVVAKRKDAATFKEFKEITRAVNWSDAFQRAKRAFDLETLTTTGKLEYARASIGGNAGRIIRLPGRLLRAADEFAKAIVQPMEAVAYAYRQGENLSLKGADLQAFIEKQLAKPKSAANVFGNSRALELTFQEDPGKAVDQLMQWREAGGLFGTLLKFTLPFVKTPANILRQGIRKSPLGSISLAYDAAQVAMGKKKFSKEQISQIAEQLLAWGAVAMLAGMGDDDDDMPFLTGSSPRYGSAEQKFKANKVPPYSIRVGENYYTYKRIEPLSTGLAFIADGLAAYRSAKNGEDGTRIMKRLIGGMKQLVVEKSFLDSLGEINKIATDPERSGMKALTNFASSWMPNVVRSTVNMFDDNVRDNKSRAKGMQWWEDQFQIVTNGMGITKAAPKYDYFGREINKDSLADSGVAWKLMRMIPIQSIAPDENMNRAETLMWRYNQANPGSEYYPDIPAYYFQREGKKLYFEGDGYSAFVQKAGGLALKQINNAFRHGYLNESKPTEKDIDLIKKIFAKARKEVRDDMYKKRQYSE